MHILLADDHAIVRSGLRRIIEDMFSDAVIDEVANCEEIKNKIREQKWSLLILDIALGDQSGLDLIPDIKKVCPDLPIVILSMYKERQFVMKALKFGALGYLTKDRAPEELGNAIRSVISGKRYLSEDTVSQIAEHIASGGSKSDIPHECLSAREYEVFLLLVSSYSVSEIASTLGLSVKTISTYRTRILEKMGMSSNAELMKYAFRQGLIK